MIEDKDFELVKDFLNGSESAFNLIVRKYQKKIYWHARRMVGNHLDADEVTQEVLIVMYQKLSSFQFNSTLFTWIYRITSTRSLNQLKKKQLKKFLFIDDNEESEPIPYEHDIAGDIDNRDKLKKLDEVLKKLPVKQREVFVMRTFDELSYEEISEITGKTVGGLKANYFHALKKVTELMNENE